MAKDDVVSVRELSSGDISEMSIVDARRAVGSGLYIVLDPTDEDWPDPNQPLPQLPYPGSDGEVLTSLDGEWQSKPMADVLGIEHAVPTIGEVLADGGPYAGQQVIENHGDAVDDGDVPNFGQVKALTPNLTLKQDGGLVGAEISEINVLSPAVVDSVEYGKVAVSGIDVWNATRTYRKDPLTAAAAIVFWHGGIWQAVQNNLNSEPVSGNPDWSLIGGTPYYDSDWTPPVIAGCDAHPVTLVPAPLAGQAAWIVRFEWEMSAGDKWTAGSGGLTLGYPDNQINLGPNVASMGNNQNNWIDDLSQDAPLPYPTFLNIWSTDYPGIGLEEATAIIATTNTAPTGGTRSLRVRTFYRIVTLADLLVADSYYSITALNQTAKTFTVNGDASAVSGAVAVVGSTANDGDYTVTSATHQDPESDTITACDHVAKTFTVAGDHTGAFPAGSSALVEGGTDKNGRYTVVSAVFGVATVITVAESIADLTDTADGTIGHPEQTILAVSESITSPT